MDSLHAVSIILYFDEDAQDSDLLQALELGGVGVIGAWAERDRNDEEGNDEQNRVSQRLGMIEAPPVWCRHIGISFGRSKVTLRSCHRDSV